MIPMRTAEHLAYIRRTFTPGTARVAVRRRDGRWTVSIHKLVASAHGTTGLDGRWEGFDITFHPTFEEAIAEMTAILPRSR